MFRSVTMAAVVCVSALVLAAAPASAAAKSKSTPSSTRDRRHAGKSRRPDADYQDVDADRVRDARTETPHHRTRQSDSGVAAVKRHRIPRIGPLHRSRTVRNRRQTVTVTPTTTKTAKK